MSDIEALKVKHDIKSTMLSPAVAAQIDALKGVANAAFCQLAAHPVLGAEMEQPKIETYLQGSNKDTLVYVCSANNQNGAKLEVSVFSLDQNSFHEVLTLQIPPIIDSHAAFSTSDHTPEQLHTLARLVNSAEPILSDTFH